MSGKKPFARAGCVRENCRSTTAGVSDASVWAEGGDNRALLHAAGGALIGGLGGGSTFGAIGGAAGAGLSSKFAPQLEGISKGVASETGSDLLGNLAANVTAGVGGALVGGTAGAATGSAVELYNQMNHQKKDLVSQACGAEAQCSDATLNAAIQAQGANADTASANMKTGALYGVPAAVVIALGPEAVTAALLAGGFDYAGSYYNFKNVPGSDAPNITNSYLAGMVGGLSTPLAIGGAAIAGLGRFGKIGANGYNAAVSGVGAFGVAGMTGNNPDAAAAGATISSALGSGAKAALPAPLGSVLNQAIQGAAGPIQTAIQNRLSK
ncbi:hypothetical protein [Paraburkholderia sp. BR10954]|uniref:hypothetical protein n=1 Tax=Paraburkholderia sp. BR10954 TaxID=3236995 RepID=UPI0034D2B0C8